MASDFLVRGEVVTRSGPGGARSAARADAAADAIAYGVPGAVGDVTYDAGADDVQSLYRSDFDAYTAGPPVHVLPGARGEGQRVRLEGADDDVIEIRTADGSLDFQRAGSLARELPSGSRDITDALSRGAAEGRGEDEPRRGQAATVRRITATPPPDVVAALNTLDTALAGLVDDEPLHRSPAALGVQLLAPFVIDPAARQAAVTFARWVERPAADDDPPDVRRRKPKRPGLYLVDEYLLLEKEGRLEQAPSSAPGTPWLLLVHGTFSHTEGAFAALRDTREWAHLAHGFAGRILALEHPTLSLSPAENVDAVASQLPRGAALHVVSHSRGGLVGDVLSLACAQHPDTRAYQRAYPGDPHPDVAALARIRATLTDRRITVRRFARVASPSRGTTLASRRLDAWAKILLNVLRLVPGVEETGVPALVRKFLLAVLEQRTDPRVLPGIEAMMPTSPCVGMLNTVGAPLDDGLASITGDVSARSFAQRLYLPVVDRFYRGPNDLVVDTASMTQGPPRLAARGARFEGADVTHFSYFSQPDSRSAVTRWLSSDAVDVPGFGDPVAEDRRRHGLRGGPGDTPPASDPAQPRVLLVPDALGTTVLTEDGGVLWPDVAALARTGPREFLEGRAGSRLGGLLEGYDDLRRGLGRMCEVIPVPWDARRPLDEAAEAFAGALGSALAAGDGTVHVVAHGAGALVVARARLAGLLDDYLWPVMLRRDGHCLLLSPPLEGAWGIEARLDGLDELTAMLAVLDPRTGTSGLARAWRACPGLAEQSTAAGAVGSVGSARSATIQQQLAVVRASWWEGLTAVYGLGVPTPGGRSADGGLVDAARGDGYVVAPGEGPHGLDRRFASVGAWAMLHDESVVDSLGELLDGGSGAAFLAALLPVTRATGRQRAWRPPVDRTLFPTREDLVRAVLHGSTAPVEEDSTLQVSVLHADLASIDDPVLLGSFDGTPITGAAATMDRILQGALNRRLVLGQYPGAAGSQSVVLDQEGRPRTVVIGLGDADAITPGRLGAGVTEAVLSLVAERMDRAGAGTDRQDLSLASALLGTGGPGALSIHASVTAIVNGVRRANRRLRDLGQPSRVAALTLVELYEERAAEAMDALERIGDDDHADGETLLADIHVYTGEGGRLGHGSRDHSGEQWRTVRAEAVQLGSNGDPGATVLSFTVIGRGARAEQQLTFAQRALIDRLVQDSIHKPSGDPQLSNTLYELLLPPAIKWQGRERENLLYVVDQAASALPLELLATRTYDGVVPIAVDVGVIRKLELATSSPGLRVATGSKALVIGNPPADAPSLPAAAAEARHVAAVLRANEFDVTELVWDGAGATSSDGSEALQILNALFAAEYRILHIAGHGVYRANRPSASGVVIGPELYLTGLEIAKMQAVPELVFLNCCHLANQVGPDGVGGADAHPAGWDHGWRPDLLASSISGTLIEAGVRAVVAAGWAVDDVAASQFAGWFYGGMLDGLDLGQATRQARRRTYFANDRRSNTWGAYQVYGQPALRLRLAVPRREFGRQLEELRLRAGNAVDAECEVIRAERDTLLASARPDWFGGQEQAVAAEVLELIGDYPQAIDEYRDALVRWGARADVRTVERLANVIAKAALHDALHPEGMASGRVGDPPVSFRTARELLERLQSIVPRTPERMGLIGSCLRREAQAARTRAQRAKALSAAATAYREAFDIARYAAGTPHYYGGLNHVVLACLARLNGAPGAWPDEELLRVIRTSRTSAAMDRRQNFWTRVADGDAEFAEALVEGTLELAETRAEIVTRYRNALARSGSRSQRLAVQEHLQNVAALLPASAAGARQGVEDILSDLGLETTP